MRVVSSSLHVAQTTPSAVALGIFDGVHCGHRVLLGKACELAKAEKIESVAYTFTPHPAQVLMPTKAPALIEPVEIRLERFAGMGLDVALIERFTAGFASTPPAAFIDDILLARLNARHVVVGEGFTFGAGGKGTTDELARRLAAHKAALHLIPPVVIDGERVSSTKIRELVRRGEVERAATLLGRPFTLIGLAMRGRERGRRLGFATANLSPQNELLPANGVYAARVVGPIGAFDAVVNIGMTPTFGSEVLKIEAHLLDFDGHTLYGTTLAVDFVARLREERKFDGPEALKAQIARDVAVARERLGPRS